jgi:hypothetical protein
MKSLKPPTVTPVKPMGIKANAAPPGDSASPYGDKDMDDTTPNPARKPKVRGMKPMGGKPGR